VIWEVVTCAYSLVAVSVKQPASNKIA